MLPAKYSFGVKQERKSFLAREALILPYSKNPDEQGCSGGYYRELIITPCLALARLTKPCPFKVLFTHIVKEARSLRVPHAAHTLGHFAAKSMGMATLFASKPGSMFFLLQYRNLVVTYVEW